MSDQREFDVVLWGATGFAGRLVAEYFAEHYAGEKLQWAVAGRNEQKLRGLLRDLDREFEGAGEVDYLVGDAFDRGSLGHIAGRTRVVCSTVGPYASYGSELVSACLANETDYCDLTGEIHWIREMIETHHEEAVGSGTRIVHCCGFDSIPSDLGTLMVQRRAEQEHGAPCEQVKLFVRGMSGGLSGGTLASMANAIEAASSDSEVRRRMLDPYGLNPEGERTGPDGAPQQGVRYDDDVGGWTGPFIMAQVNEKVVRRSNALLGYEYGRDFRYSECTAFGGDAKGAVSAGGFAAGMTGFAGAMALKPTRWLLEKLVLPKPGEGPSRKAIEQGYFEIELIGEGREPHGESFRVRCRVSADSDPGYGATAIMLGESAVCLAKNELEEGKAGGILTPATAMGTRLVERLDEAGVEFSVESNEVSGESS